MIKFFTSTIADGNMSYKLGARDEIDANHERFFANHGVNPHKVVYMQQVHGSRIGVVKRPQLRKNTDGLISKKPGLWLAVYHADCIPLFFIDEEVAGKFKPAGAVGLAHIGWRGVVAGLPGKMVGEMVKHFKTDPANLKVKFGPFICNLHYDTMVSDERAKVLPTTRLEGDRLGLDLKKAVIEQLGKAGIKPENIDSTAECTAEHPDRYWSYHHVREKIGGVMVSVIGMENKE